MPEKKSCEHFWAIINRMDTGPLPEATEKLLAQHLEHCPSCKQRAETADAEMMRTVQGTLSVPSYPPHRPGTVSGEARELLRRYKETQ